MGAVRFNFPLIITASKSLKMYFYYNIFVFGVEYIWVGFSVALVARHPIITAQRPSQAFSNDYYYCVRI